jgi:hypothetical protein
MLAEMLEHVRNLDRRDRLRTWWGTLHTTLTMIPLLLFLGGAWYLYANIDGLARRAAEQAMRAASLEIQSDPGAFVRQFQQFIPASWSQQRSSQTSSRR